MVVGPDDPPLPQPASTGAPSQAAESKPEEKLSPLVRRLASEHNIDLTGVRGSGTGGRVTKADVLRLLEERKSAQLQRAAAPPASPFLTDFPQRD